MQLQLIIVIAIAIIALIVLIRRLRRKPSCHGCGLYDSCDKRKDKGCC